MEDEIDTFVAVGRHNDDNDIPARASANEMDEQRNQQMAYAYLVHLEETKKWIELCISDTLPPTTELEEGLQNGVYLAKLGHFFSPNTVPLKRIYDSDQSRYTERGLHFRHTDNISYFRKAMEKINLPKIFYPETTDIYDRKNMPRTIYCLHALSLYLFKLGLAPQIQNLYGKVEFTEEEICTMSQELKKYGLEMPAFGKIGGILAREMPIDEAALHAAVIAINEAIEGRVIDETFANLKNAAAMLENIDDANSQLYQEMLFDAKKDKGGNTRGSQSPNLNDSALSNTDEEHDVYEELLTQAEIQGYINKSNLMAVLSDVNMSLDDCDETRLLQLLRSRALTLPSVRSDNIKQYRDELSKMRAEKSDCNSDPHDEDKFDYHLTKDDISLGVHTVNSTVEKVQKRETAIANINLAIDSQDSEALIQHLLCQEAELPSVYEQGRLLYAAELFNLRQGYETDDLTHDILQDAILVLSAVVLINSAVDRGNGTEMLTRLSDEAACVDAVDPGYVERYLQTLEHNKRNKLNSSGVSFLTHGEIQNSIDDVNDEVTDEHSKIDAIRSINNAVLTGDRATVVKSLQLPAAKLENVQEPLSALYQQSLNVARQHRADKSQDENSVLWLDEIQDAIVTSNEEADDTERLAVAVGQINRCVTEPYDDSATTMKHLLNKVCNLRGVIDRCEDLYYSELCVAKKIKQENATGDATGWINFVSRSGVEYHYNVLTGNSTWDPEGPRTFISDSYLSKNEIQSIISSVTANYDREVYLSAHEPAIVKIQALFRGQLARIHYQEQRDFVRTKLPAIVRIQSWWKGRRQHRSYLERLGYLKSHESDIINLQACLKMFIARKKYTSRLKYMKDNEAAVIKIQTFVKTSMAKHDYYTLTKSSDPPVNVVRKFAHLLDYSENDYEEEIEVQRLRAQIVTTIRSNQQVEQHLNTMDIMIGLLVKNRITLQDVISHEKTMKKTIPNDVNKGLKSLTKEMHDRLEAYQYLFYLLQTKPVYLARLIFEMPQSRSTKFMESVILTLYNYASNQREEYLLLMLFEQALRQEIISKVDRVSEIVTGNPMVIKMVIHFNRGSRGMSSLRDLLQPLVTDVTNDRTLHINTNPVDVYKQMINTMESETGQASSLPYDVSTAQALQHEHVIEKIKQSMVKLMVVGKTFLNRITSADNIPYSLRYIAKVLREALREKFPDSSSDEILKIVGNLIYYRYMNPTIAAPDAFDIIDVGPENILNPDQRRNLGSVAKLLQFAAAGQIFEGENSYLSDMNDYIVDAHKKFKLFIIDVCDVEEPESQFDMDQYSDVATLSKPLIYITLQELVNTHSLLLEHEDKIAPERSDPIHELLSDVGEVPDIGQLTGESEYDQPQLQQLGSTEISLVLTNKFAVPEGDDSDLQMVYNRTREMVVDIIRAQGGESLLHILNSPATDDEEEAYFDFVKKRSRQEKKVEKAGQIHRSHSTAGDSRVPFEVLKQKVLKNLSLLEESGVISVAHGYQDVIDAIVKDIRNRRLYRQRRRKDLVRHKTTVGNLENKEAFFADQVTYYKRYIESCMEKMAGAASSRRQSGKYKANKSTKQVLKYSAAKLHEKRILIEIEDHPTSQFKNIQFEISLADVPGTFDVSAKVLGVALEKVVLVFQDLLQLQYEGVAVMKLANIAKVNVNLLIYLLNKKFYGF